MCDVNIDNPIDAVATIFDPIGVFGEHGLGLDPFGLDLDEGEKRRLDQRSEAQQRLQEFDLWAKDYTDPVRYQAMTDREVQQATRGVQNRYNAIGLAGSGADIGGQASAEQSVRQTMMDRQMMDRARIEQTRQGYATQIFNLDAADQNAKNAAMSQLLQAGGMAAGFIAGGPAGAAVGSQAGAAFGPDQISYASASEPGMYFSESYGAPAGSDPYANWWNENNAPQSQYSNWWNSSPSQGPSQNPWKLEY